ncbi:MAG: DUF4292 domain-containing protein [Deltaproteobacteria bacterium]|nr:DUF4292 domain-containing protein [Deltaproteobacteria bacterium]
MILSRSSILSLILLYLSCSLSGCIASKPHAGRVSPPPESLLAKAVEKDKKPLAFRATAHVDIDTPQGRHVLTAVLLLKRPDHLRIEFLPVIGPPDMIFVLRGEFLEIFLPQRGELYSGKASRKNLVRFLPVGLEKEELLAFLAGSTPDPSGPGSILISEPEGDSCRIDLKSGERITRSFRVDPIAGHLLQVDVLSDGGWPRYSAIFGDFAQLDGTYVPRHLSLLTGGLDKSKFTIRYEDLETVSAIDDDTFALTLPEGVRRFSLDEPLP